MKLYPICHEHNVQASQSGSCPLCDRWWATYNAALGGLIAFTQDDDGSREFADECRAEARRIADAEHGELPGKVGPEELAKGGRFVMMVDAAHHTALVKAARDALVALLEALKPFEDKP